MEPDMQMAKYKCENCGEKWKVKNSTGGAKTCESCGKKGILPYDFEPYVKVSMHAWLLYIIALENLNMRLLAYLVYSYTEFPYSVAKNVW